MKKYLKLFFVSVIFLFFSQNVRAESLTCQYDMGENETPIIVEVGEDGKVTARELRDIEIYPVKTSSLLYDSFLANNKTVLKCPSEIYRAIGRSNISYEVCSNREYCANLDLMFVTGVLDVENSSADILLSSNEKYMSCEYSSNGALAGSNNAKILYNVKNGVASFSVQYRTSSDSINYVLTPSENFVIANSCEEQGSLWISSLQTPERTISSSADSKHKMELTLVSDENREILDQDQTNEANKTHKDQHGFNPGKICEGDNCNISLASFCNMSTVARTLKFLGLLFSILKILVPTIIIVIGFVNLFKIITSGKYEDAKKYSTSIFKRVLIGVLIFLLPEIIYALFNAADSFIEPNDASKFSNCVDCILKPDNCVVNENNND